MEKKIDSNVLVLREDIINTWKWTEDIKKEIESMKKRQDRIENYLKNLSSLLSSREENGSRHRNIVEYTEL
tara:strand:- start:18001 stop:18213 length:213 start_codon:yes stop_codon:yes gene_type:complete